MFVFILDILKNLKSPKIAIILGYGGLIPFLLFSICTVLELDIGINSSKTLLFYSSIILSFLGAVSWGLITRKSIEDKNKQKYIFIWSVFPALTAFFSLLSTPVFSYGLLFFGFISAYAADKKITKLLKVPRWYLHLRFRLTLIVLTCLLSSLIWTLLYSI